MDYSRGTLYVLNLIGFIFCLIIGVSFVAILLGATNIPQSTYIPLLATPLLAGLLSIVFFKGMSAYAKPEKKIATSTVTLFKLM